MTEAWAAPGGGERSAALQRQVSRPLLLPRPPCSGALQVRGLLLHSTRSRLEETCLRTTWHPCPSGAQPSCLSPGDTAVPRLSQQQRAGAGIPSSRLDPTASPPAPRERQSTSSADRAGTRCRLADTDVSSAPSHRRTLLGDADLYHVLGPTL